MISVISMEIEKHGSIYFLRIYSTQAGAVGIYKYAAGQKLRQTSKLESSQGRADPVPEAAT